MDSQVPTATDECLRAHRWGCPPILRQPEKICRLAAKARRIGVGLLPPSTRLATERVSSMACGERWAGKPALWIAPPERAAHQLLSASARTPPYPHLHTGIAAGRRVRGVNLQLPQEGSGESTKNLLFQAPHRRGDRRRAQGLGNSSQGHVHHAPGAGESF